MLPAGAIKLFVDRAIRSGHLVRTVARIAEVRHHLIGHVVDAPAKALHQSHSDEKRTRQEAIARLRLEQTKLQNRLDKLYEDRLDGFIEPAFFERKTREWKHTQARLSEQIAQHEAANHDYLE